MSEAPLKLENLFKSYTAGHSTVQAVRGVSFAMEPGEIFGLLGPNGAGKTSIISIITTLEKATSGSCKIFGEEVGVDKQTTKALIGVVPQEMISHGFFTTEEVLQFHSGYYGRRKNQDRINFLLDRLGLAEHRHKRMKQLSGGMKRRLLIAKALVHEPKLLILDEPTAGVDIELRNSLWSFVRELNGEGLSILLTTHYLEEAENLCDRVAIIHKGKLRKIGETRGLIKSLTSREITLELASASSVQHPMLTRREGANLVFQVGNDTDVGDILTDLGLPLKEIRDVKIREGRLEDAFIKVLGESAND